MFVQVLLFLLIPVRQYTNEIVNEPTTLKIFTGADGHFILYEDDGISQDYLQGKFSRTNISWNEQQKQVTLSPLATKGFKNENSSRTFKIQLIPGDETRIVKYENKPVTINFNNTPVKGNL